MKMKRDVAGMEPTGSALVVEIEVAQQVVGGGAVEEGSRQQQQLEDDADEREHAQVGGRAENEQVQAAHHAQDDEAVHRSFQYGQVQEGMERRQQGDVGRRRQEAQAKLGQRQPLRQWCQPALSFICLAPRCRLLPK